MVGGEFGNVFIGPSIMECEGGRGVRGCINRSIMECPSIMECEGGRGVRGCIYRSNYNELCDSGRGIRGMYL